MRQTWNRGTACGSSIRVRLNMAHVTARIRAPRRRGLPIRSALQDRIDSSLRSQVVAIRLVELEVLRIAEPGRRLRQTVPQALQPRVTGLPAEQLAGFAICGAEPLDFT